MVCQVYNHPNQRVNGLRLRCDARDTRARNTPNPIADVWLANRKLVVFLLIG